MNTDKVVTIEDIAKRAGVGRGTVDRVLHNRGRVSEETREKVLRCVKELNYQPNIAARMLARKRNYRIAVVYHDTEKEFWGQIHDGIQKAANEYKTSGVSVEEFVLPQIDIERQLDIIEKVIESRFDGLAIVPYNSPRIVERLNFAIEHGMKVITFNTREKAIKANYIGQDGLQSGRTAGRMICMMAKQNARYAIFSAHNKGMAQIDERAQGFLEVIKTLRPDLELVSLFSLPEDHDIVYREVLNIFRNCQMDAIYVTTAISSTVAKALDELNLQKKIQFIAHDCTDTIMNYMEKGIIDVSIGQEPERQGYKAVDQICRELILNDSGCGDVFTRISIILKENLQFH